jgi:hypothetical protein
VKESDIEKYFNQRIADSGGTARKFVSPGNPGMPDRLCCFPSGFTCFVELKAPGKKPSDTQIAEMRKLEALGFFVAVADSYAAVDFVVARIRSIIARLPTARQLADLEAENARLRACIPEPRRAIK